MKTIVIIPALVSVFVLVGCRKESVPEVKMNAGTYPKTACGPAYQNTVDYTALAAIGGSGSGFCTGKLKVVWENCYGGGTYPSCKNTSYQVITSTVNPVSCEQIYNILTPWTNYPNVTYAQQCAIIDWAKAQANASRPSCQGGGPMTLYDLGFCRDPFIPSALCITAKYYCCVP